MEEEEEAEDEELFLSPKSAYLQRSVHGLEGQVEEEGLGGVVLVDDGRGPVSEQAVSYTHLTLPTTPHV